MMSLHNNLLLHTHYDPRQALRPQKEASHISALEKEIKNKKKGTYEPEDTGEKWYEKVLKNEEPAEKRFNFKYEPSTNTKLGQNDSTRKVYHVTATK